MSAFALELDTAGSTVTVDIRNPDDLNNSLWTQSGPLDDGFNNLTATGSVDMGFLHNTGGFVVDYKIALRFPVDSGVRLRMSWNTDGSDSWIYTQKSSNSDYKYKVHWNEASRIEILLDGVVCKEFTDSRCVEVDPDGSVWYSMAFDDIPVENGGSDLVVRFYIPNTACKYSNSGTLQNRVDDGSSLLDMRFRNILAGSTLVLSTREDNSGLLAGIIEWLRSILNGIIELPSRIWSAISSGLQDLFVPDAEFLAVYSEQWQILMQEHLGIVWEAVDSTFMVADLLRAFPGSTGSIEFPLISIPLCDTIFYFGGWTIDLNISSNPVFSILFGALKTIVNIVCTLAFINSLKRRFEELIDN